jgi:hypothetical protein
MFSVSPGLTRQSSVRKAVVRRGAVVLVGVTEGDRAGVGDAQQEAREIGSAAGDRGGLRRRAGEGEGAARILLRDVVELEAAEIAAKVRP